LNCVVKTSQFYNKISFNGIAYKSVKRAALSYAEFPYVRTSGHWSKRVALAEIS